MKNRLIFTITRILAVMLCMAASSITALAVDVDEYDGNNAYTESETSASSKTGAALTPDGNLTLVDDIEGVQSGDKEFITVQTKDGNYFYLIIDHAGNENNVYFLNLVDEEDLLALIDDEEFLAEYENEAANDSIDVKPRPTDDPGSPSSAEPDVEQAETDSNRGMIAASLIVVMIIGAAVCFFKFRKPVKPTKGKTDLDEYDFVEDEDEDEGCVEEDAPEQDGPDKETEREEE